MSWLHEIYHHDQKVMGLNLSWGEPWGCIVLLSVIKQKNIVHSISYKWTVSSLLSGSQSCTSLQCVPLPSDGQLSYHYDVIPNLACQLPHLLINPLLLLSWQLHNMGRKKTLKAERKKNHHMKRILPPPDLNVFPSWTSQQQTQC